jgi:phenylacetate-CoA ligase
LTHHEWRARLPGWAKRSYRATAACVPYRWRYGGREYRCTRDRLRESDFWPEERIRDWQCRETARLIRHAFLHVPYYRRLAADLNLRPQDVRSPEDLRRLPLLERDTLAARAGELISETTPRRRLLVQSTGGTSGRPLSVTVDRAVTLQRERAFWDAFLARFGIRRDERMVVLRNDRLRGPGLWDYSPATRRLRLDAFRLAPSNVGQYIEAIAASGIRILHTYPSAAATLVKLAQEAGCWRALPLRWIVATSENVYPGQREALEAACHARFVSMYGHSERCVFAGECECGPACHVEPRYGLVELTDEQGRAVEEPGVWGEIVGTGFVNDAMPLIRYRTGDFAQYAPGPACRCGRSGPRFAAVRGRWLQELIRKPDGGVVSITALNMHSPVFHRCRRFQFLQNDPRELQVCVVPGDGFGAEDEEAIRRELSPKLGGALRVVVRRVAEIAPTAAGKHRFLVQRLTAPDGA